MSSYEILKDLTDEELPRNVSIKTLHTWKTERNADSVEWCPYEGFKNYFVCGNYQLISDSDLKERSGLIILFCLNIEKGLQLEQTVETAAVLDLKWSHKRINDLSLLGVASSDAKITLFNLNTTTTPSLEFLTDYQFTSDTEELLVLSLDWSNQQPEIVCSDSKGGVHILKLQDGVLSLKVSVVKFHEFETWIAAFYYWDTNIFFSGGDDCILYKYDQRVGLEPISTNKSHEAGVTSLHSNSEQEHIIATGSYDEHVRIWDIRNFRCPRDIIKTPGPSWRVKWDPFKHNHLLVASMLGGLHIISTIDTPQIVDSYYEHKNLVYGADWCFLAKDEIKHYSEGAGASALIASCSFYDNLLCVSKTKCDF